MGAESKRGRSDAQLGLSGVDRETTGLQERGVVSVHMTLAEALQVGDNLGIAPDLILIVGDLRVVDRP